MSEAGLNAVETIQKTGKTITTKTTSPTRLIPARRRKRFGRNRRFATRPALTAGATGRGATGT
jgi:hypothetical protein